MFKSLSVLMLASFLLSLNAFAASTYSFDNTHTYVLWRVSHFGYSELTGKMFASGTLQYNAEKPELSQANLIIDIKSMSTGIPKLDHELIGSTYFDSEKFPTASFVTKSIKTTGKSTAKITGTLTIRGISKTIDLNIILQKQGEHFFFKRHTLGLKGNTIIKRSDFGIRAYLPDVGDDVDLEIQAEAIEEKK